MATILFPYILCWTLLTQSTGPTPSKIEAATQLTEQDIEAISKLLPEAPWLLDVPRTQVPVRQYVEAYLPPMTTTASIRRGRVVPLWRTIYLPTASQQLAHGLLTNHMNMHKWHLRKAIRRDP